MSRVKRHSQTKAKRGWLLHGPPRKRTRHRRQQPRKINASLDSVSKTDASNVKTLALSTTTESLDVDNSLLGSTARCSLTADSSRRNLFRWFSFSTVFGSKFYGGITGANRNLKLVFEFLCKLMNCGVHGLKGLREVSWIYSCFHSLHMQNLIQIIPFNICTQSLSRDKMGVFCLLRCQTCQKLYITFVKSVPVGTLDWLVLWEFNQEIGLCTS